MSDEYQLRKDIDSIQRYTVELDGQMDSLVHVDELKQVLNDYFNRDEILDLLEINAINYDNDGNIDLSDYVTNNQLQSTLQSALLNYWTNCSFNLSIDNSYGVDVSSVDSVKEYVLSLNQSTIFKYGNYIILPVVNSFNADTVEIKYLYAIIKIGGNVDVIQLYPNDNDVDISSLLDSKVDKVTGKGLSSNDYTTAEKNKLAGVADGANNYIHPNYTSRVGQPTANQTPSFGESFNVSQLRSDNLGHIIALTTRKITIPSTVASPSSNGLMSKEDKVKLDGLSDVNLDGYLTESDLNSRLSTYTTLSDLYSTIEDYTEDTFTVSSNNDIIGLFAVNDSDGALSQQKSISILLHLSPYDNIEEAVQHGYYIKNQAHGFSGVKLVKVDFTRFSNEGVYEYVVFTDGTLENCRVYNTANLNNDGGGSVDLSNYFTKSEINTLLNNKASINHTHTEYLTEHQSLTNYVQKSSTTGLLKNDGSVDTNKYYKSILDIVDSYSATFGCSSVVPIVLSFNEIVGDSEEQFTVNDYMMYPEIVTVLQNALNYIFQQLYTQANVRPFIEVVLTDYQNNIRKYTTINNTDMECVDTTKSTPLEFRITEDVYNLLMSIHPDINDRINDLFAMPSLTVIHNFVKEFIEVMHMDEQLRNAFEYNTDIPFYVTFPMFEDDEMHSIFMIKRKASLYYESRLDENTNGLAVSGSINL